MNELIWYQRKLNLLDASFVRIEHEDAMVAITYRIICSSGKNYILKISTRTKDYLRELYCLERFAGLLPVPHIEALVPPEGSMHGAILMEYCPGDLLDVSKLTFSMAFEAGSLLARIHFNREEGYGDLTKRENLIVDPRVYFSQKFQEDLDECKGNLSQSLIDQCSSYVDKHIDLLLLADGPCIVHRDFRPGNILVDQGKVQAIIDWATSEASFAQEDFCSIEHNWQMTSENKQAFLAGYESVRPVPDFQALTPLLRLNKAIGIIGFTIKCGTWKDAKAWLYERNLNYLKNFFR